MSTFLHPDSIVGEVRAPFAPFRLILGVLILVVILLALILAQGFFIALAELDRQQTIVLVYPLYIYAAPAYYCVAKWQGRKLPEKAFLLSIMQAISSFLLVAFIKFIWLELPFAHTFTEAYILVAYIALSVLGAARGKKKAIVAT